MQRRDEAIPFKTCETKEMPIYGDSSHPLPFSEGGGGGNLMLGG